MAIKTFLYPALGANTPKDLSKVTNIQSDVIAAVTKYCKQEGITDPQGILLPGMKDALKKVKEYKEEITAAKNDLSVRAGIDEKGHLVIALTGILKRDGKPVKIDENLILRKEFAKLIKEMQEEANVVVNLQKGDQVIDRAAEKQGKKFGTPVEEPDDVDFSGITTGNVILAAHGSRTEVNGTVIGTKLGKRSAAQIVELLTDGDDKSKRLSKNFSGTVWLSGCFTAAGGIAPPNEDYDYESFARSVWELLKQKGYKKASVKGQPGQARTSEEGNKSSVTPTGQKDYDKLKKELTELQEDIKKAAVELSKLKKKYVGDDEALRADPTYVKQFMKLNELKKIAVRVNAEKESHVIEGLVNTYGRQGR